MARREQMQKAVRVIPLFLASLAMLSGRSTAASDTTYTTRIQHLPGTDGTVISMDYIAFDPATRLVWVPAGNSGAVDVIDSSTGVIRQISGLPTAEIGTGERGRVAGPSSVAIGEGSVFIGNRADSSVCAFDARTLARGPCHRLASMPDGLVFAAPTKEVWVTTPREKSVCILDAATLEEKAVLTFDGAPEGFAVDARHSRYYTNLEDRDRTLAVDLETRKTVATWNPTCGEGGPHGLRIDADAGELFVACSERVEVLDARRDGAILSTIETGDGVDDIDYAPETHLLYAGAARAGKLTIARVAPDGRLSLVASVQTPPGARNPAVTDTGAIYLAHSAFGGLRDLVIVEPGAPRAGGPRVPEPAASDGDLREMKKAGVLLEFDPAGHRAIVDAERWRALPAEERIHHAETLVRLCHDPHGSERLTIVDARSGDVIATLAPAPGRD